MKISVLNINFENNGVPQVIHPVIIQDENHMILVDVSFTNWID